MVSSSGLNFCWCIWKLHHESPVIQCDLFIICIFGMNRWWTDYPSILRNTIKEILKENFGDGYTLYPNPSLCPAGTGHTDCLDSLGQLHRLCSLTASALWKPNCSASPLTVSPMSTATQPWHQNGGNTQVHKKNKTKKTKPVTLQKTKCIHLSFIE